MFQTSRQDIRIYRIKKQQPNHLTKLCHLDEEFSAKPLRLQWFPTDNDVTSHVVFFCGMSFNPWVKYNYFILRPLFSIQASSRLHRISLSLRTLSVTYVQGLFDWATTRVLTWGLLSFCSQPFLQGKNRNSRLIRESNFRCVEMGWNKSKKQTNMAETLGKISRETKTYLILGTFENQITKSGWIDQIFTCSILKVGLWAPNSTGADLLAKFHTS